MASEVLVRARNQVGMTSSTTGGSGSGSSTPLAVHSTALDSAYSVGRRGTGYSNFTASSFPLNAINYNTEDGRRT